MKKIIATAIFAALCVGQVANAKDGTVKFVGDIVTAPCEVAQNSWDQTVQMAQVKTATFADAGAKSADKKFQISLLTCDVTQFKNVSVSFAGQTNGDDATLLALDGGQGAAENVGVAIYDGKGKKLALGTATADTALQVGSNTLYFSAAYVSTKKDVKAGSANATADFNLTYK